MANHFTDRLIKTDKNGTQTFASCVCKRCGGSGKVPYIVDNGICWKCGGSGTVAEYHYRVMTEEYQQKLYDRRLAKAVAEAPKRNAEFLKRHGFDENGTAWVVAGKTFEIKDELKEAGAKFDSAIGWHFDHNVETYKCFELHIEEIAEKTIIGDWEINPDVREIKKLCAEKSAKLCPTEEAIKSEYIGNIGDKIEVKVLFKRQYEFISNYTYYGETNYINTFEDESGNILVWKTSSYQSIDEGNTYTIKGTIKDHKEYRNVKQTVLTRCKIVA